MRSMFAALAAGIILAPVLAQAQGQATTQAQSQISCAQLPKAAEFVNAKLKPGPNTDAAKRHIEAAQHATSDQQCVAELRKVDYYAKRSMAADRREAAKTQAKPQTQPQAQAAAQAQSPITCAQLPKAAEFVNTKLKPGPNTDAAKRHLEAAQHATSDQQCVAELHKVDYYAKRSLAADQHTAANAAPGQAAPAAPPAHVRCGDVLHPTLPGGVDYHGPPVPGCLPVRLW
ncbi:MAG TPA: hypothetical protein VET84_11025 [Stellaceae bacterium]|nr:hypothetical protein [Stellaceae bacterium]